VLAAASDGLLSPLLALDPKSPAQVLLSAGDNVDRIKSEAAYAHLCGAAPIPPAAEAPNTWPNRGGNRGANNALYVVVLGRLR
jgi:transposase